MRSSRKIDEIFQKIEFAQKITADELEAPMTAAVTSRVLNVEQGIVNFPNRPKVEKKSTNSASSFKM